LVWGAWAVSGASEFGVTGSLFTGEAEAPAPTFEPTLLPLLAGPLPELPGRGSWELKPGKGETDAGGLAESCVDWAQTALGEAASTPARRNKRRERCMVCLQNCCLKTSIRGP
jgi:hypothetical protein